MILCVLMLTAGHLFASAPAMPDWMDALKRESLYPANKYYTGFSSAVPGKGEDKQEVTDRVKQNARLDAAASIQVTVAQTVERTVKNMQSGEHTHTTDLMTSNAVTETAIKDIPGLKTETWENPKTGEISAFAFVKTSELTSRLMRRITANITRIDVEMQNAEAMAARGDKSQAREALDKLAAMFADTEADQRVMLSIDATVTDEDLQTEESARLKQKYNELAASLKNGIGVYIMCEADLFGTPYNMTEKTIKGNLSGMGCSFLNSEEEADWVIRLKLTAREYNQVTYGQVTSYTAYVDADVTMDKKATGQRVYEDALSQKGTHTHNYTEAARDGYKQITDRISELIKAQMQQ